MNLYQLQQIEKVFSSKETNVSALNLINLEISQGEFIVILGVSGSGKSTLLSVLAGLSSPTAGEIKFKGDVLSGDQEQLTDLRRDHIGIIFQHFNLLDDMTALQNTELPLFFSDEDPRSRKSKAEEMLEKVGLGEHLQHLPAELSGGQQQRVAIARALITNPSVILADEPTGDLDTATGEEILTLLHQINREQNATVIMVTHDESVIAEGMRVIEMKDGQILNDIIV